MGGFQWRDVTMGGAEPERIRAARVTAGLLPTLGVQPQMGRWFLPEEDRANGRPVMVISDALWRRRFQQNRSIVGRTIPIDGVPTEIIGVMPPDVRVSAGRGAARHAAGGAGRVVDSARDQSRGRASAAPTISRSSAGLRPGRRSRPPIAR